MEGAAMAGEAMMGAADATMGADAGMAMMAAGSAPALMTSFLLPGIGLGLLKGLFLAELLKQKPRKRQKAYGHHPPSNYVQPQYGYERRFYH